MLKYIAIFLSTFPCIAYTQNIQNLTCNYVSSPAGIDDVTPQLSWNIHSTVRGERQTGYQVLVSSSSRRLASGDGDVWNSGRISSEQNLYHRYAGKKLRSGKKYFWKVRIWNKDKKVSAWSADASWTMGLLQPGDWKAQWITASKWFYPPAYRSKGLEINQTG